MKLNTIQRPSLLPTAACAQSALLLAERAPVSRAHQVLTRAELGWTIGGAYAANGTSGFTGSTGADVKPMTGDASGVPPRGRPV